MATPILPVPITPTPTCDATWLVPNNYANVIASLDKPPYDANKWKTDVCVFGNSTIPAAFKTHLLPLKYSNINVGNYLTLLDLYKYFDNISTNISRINPQESLIVSQSRETIIKWLGELNNIYGSDESNAIRIQEQIFTSIYNELTRCLMETTINPTRYDFNKKFMDIPEVFDPFIANFDSIKLKKMMESLQKNNINIYADFTQRIGFVIQTYKKKHLDYLTTKKDELNNIDTRASITDGYINTKRLKEELVELSEQLAKDKQRLNIIKNVYDDREKKQIIEEFDKLLTNVNKLKQQQSAQESFLKDKEENINVKKEHIFSLFIKLNTNVLDNEEIKYSPNMTVKNLTGDKILFTPLRPIQLNIAESNLSENADHLYSQFVEKSQFSSLMNRIARIYRMDTVVDSYLYEYTYVKQKKENDLAISNINSILSIFFKKNTPFYLNGERYTVFTKEWDNVISLIKKNDVEEIYNGKETKLSIPGIKQASNIIPNAWNAIKNMIPTARPPTQIPTAVFIWERMQVLFDKFNTLLNNSNIITIDQDELHDISEEYHYLKKEACLDDISVNETEKLYKSLWQWCNNPKYNTWDSVQSISGSCNRANEIVREIGNILVDPLKYDYDDILDKIDEYHLYKNIAIASGYAKSIQTTDIYEIVLLECTKENDNTTDEYKLYTDIVESIKNKTFLNDMQGFRKKIDEYNKYEKQFKQSKGFSLLSPGSWFQSGGATKYIDVGENELSKQQQQQNIENKIKMIQTAESELSAKIESTKDSKEKREIRWDYFITVDLYLYPGDTIPLSASASLYCSIKKDNINKLIDKIQYASNKSKPKSYLAPYTPVNTTRKQRGNQDAKTKENENNKTQKVLHT